MSYQFTFIYTGPLNPLRRPMMVAGFISIIQIRKLRLTKGSYPLKPERANTYQNQGWNPFLVHPQPLIHHMIM